MFLTLWLLACAPEPSDRGGPTGATTTPAGTPGGSTADSGDASSTGPTTTYDCSQPWPDSLGATVVGSVPASEDFDIDHDGYLIHVEQRNLVARSSVDGSVTIIAPNLTFSASGTRVLRNGDVVVGDAFDGSLVLVDRQTGATTHLLSRAWPNGIDVDADDNIYVSDFTENGSVTRINAYDPTDMEVLLDGVPHPNGVALSPDGNTLYVAFNNEAEIWALHRDPAGDWGDPSLFVDGLGSAQSVTTDVCGTLYWEAFDTIRRQLADGSAHGDVTTAPGFQYLPNIRWGHGQGGFEAEHLYALSRGELWSFHVGIPGKRHISDQ